MDKLLWVKMAFSRGVWTYEDCTVTPWKRYGLMYIVEEGIINWFSGAHHGTCCTVDEARELVELHAGEFVEAVTFARQLRFFDFVDKTLFYAERPNTRLETDAAAVTAIKSDHAV